jgi:beta-glucanase (GH16 family)
MRASTNPFQLLAVLVALPALAACSGDDVEGSGGGPGATTSSSASTADSASSGAGGTGATGSSSSSGTSAGGGPANGWSLVWSDEFDGDAIDTSKWTHEVNCWGGGNGEQQCYVSDAKNAFVEGGYLHIVALDDAPTGAIGGPDDNPAMVTLPYSSARLTSRGKGDFEYGRIEARMKLPHGQGLWPAFWMLPTDSVYGGWAASGEIDIMEAINLGPGSNNAIHGTLHYGGAWPANVHTGTSTTPAANVWEADHVYAVEWEEGEVRWFVDDEHYATQTEWNSTAGAYPAPFDEKFFMLLNVAVGGQWPGPPDASTTFPQEMVVDYVRVYECAADPLTGHGCGTKDPSVQPL